MADEWTTCEACGLEYMRAHRCQAREGVHPSNLTNVVDVLEGDLATLRAENERLRAENDRLRAALTEMVRVHGGSHSEDCHACGAHDDDVSDDPDTPDPHCDCGALATRQAARAALRGGT